MSKPDISRCMKRRPSDTNIHCHYPLVAQVAIGRVGEGGIMRPWCKHEEPSKNESSEVSIIVHCPYNYTREIRRPLLDLTEQPRDSSEPYC